MFAVREAAAMLCGGITTYAPLKRHSAGPMGRRLGADVTATSSSKRKEALCKDVLGAHGYLDMSDAADVAANYHWFEMLLLVRTNGKLVPVAVPETPLSFYAFSIIMRQINVVGSAIGSPDMIQETLQFVQKNERAAKGAQGWCALPHRLGKRND
ncbi:hypothetical protein SDRG_11676 [Saprolegnia diclina VS20]|uniref:Alcohol dehydrogenase-like C-terminal domain-containing protein n=1 Tax=Saprolegnia diclina (strain VS20) TaxID=1156394 RepID=T0Q7L8_SAPDV|nr:hypothetical protein SDRG_11676 [Saprolegnia diclina VS20]EQC30621.1 hypothetical protein SDRG_11676 [Saprolegnia diclina VS20]|eukprot:XP_008615947.1 hypothetical protein SDRG_11676 [Saprolegnia diclina VS20]